MSFIEIIVLLYRNSMPFLKEMLRNHLESSPQPARNESSTGKLTFILLLAAVIAGTVAVYQWDTVSELEKKLKEKPPAEQSPTPRMHSEDYLQRMLMQEQLRVDHETILDLKENNLSKQLIIDDLKRQLKECQNPRVGKPQLQPQPRRNQLRNRLKDITDKEGN